MSILLIFHIAAGLLGLLFGAAAMCYKKGSRLHKKAGKYFAISMLTMSASGSYIAFTKGVTLSVLGGALTFYLVSTAWLVLKRKPGQVGALEWLALLIGLATASSYFFFGVATANSESGVSSDGLPYGVFYFFGSITTIAVLLDVTMILRGGVQGAHRIARHVWRICFAMFMATASLFLGQMQAFPEVIRKIEFLAVPVIMVMIFSLFWLLKVLFTKAYKKTPALKYKQQTSVA